MPEPDGSKKNGTETQTDSGRKDEPRQPLRKESPATDSSDLRIPKNRSTGNLLSYASQNTEKGRLRVSFDAGQAGLDFDPMSKSPVMAEPEHGLGTSGLRRIRQYPPPRTPTMPITPSDSSSGKTTTTIRSSSMNLTLNPRVGSTAASSGPSSPTLNFTEDLTRFPSESLHSFSFAHQSEDFIHSRQNVLKRSVEFMSQKMGWGVGGAGIASAQARIDGDHETQNMLELLARAKVLGANNLSGFNQIHGPLTGPAFLNDAKNVFDNSFVQESKNPVLVESPSSSPVLTKSESAFHSNPALRSKPAEPQDFKPASTPPTQTSEDSSRSPTNESGTTAKTTPPRRGSLKRTYTDTAPLTLQSRLLDTLAQPFTVGDSLQDSLLLSPTTSHSGGLSSFAPSFPPSTVHGHSSRWTPAAQAIFTTETASPYTILAANDLACLVFGVTNAEVRKMGILEVVRPERRSWLEEKLSAPGSLAGTASPKHTFRSSKESQSQRTSPTTSASSATSSSSASPFLLGRAGGVTASLLSRPNSRQSAQKTQAIRRAQTDDGAGSSIVDRKKATKNPRHPSNKSRGVLLCGDVVPIQKRNGITGSASLWVKEKKNKLVWVLEEIHEDGAVVSLNDDALVTKISGATDPIWGENIAKEGIDVGMLLPQLPRQGIDGRSGEVDYAEVSKRKYFTARHARRVNIPTIVTRVPGGTDLQVCSFPHIAGIMVLSAETLEITSSNSVFSAALFGQEKPDGKPITDLIPDFDRMLKILIEEDGVNMIDGIVVPEHSFRRARGFLALRDGKEDAASYFLRPDGLPAKHRDGSEIKIDAQLRVVKSESPSPAYQEHVIEEEQDPHEPPKTELVYALWITYSRHIHSSRPLGTTTPLLAPLQSPLHQPSPGQTGIASPMEMDTDDSKKESSHASILTAQLKAAAKNTVSKLTGRETKTSKDLKETAPSTTALDPAHKKTIADFVILEEMGQGAYGQVKLARFKQNNTKVVLKYVTKRRILVDTWTRDRRLGTVPLEIHVLDYLRRDGLKHPNIVEMADFFEDDVNYYIEMLPHGYPGMDLFDYIELRVNMEENECRSIFVQVARAIHHLHTKALVVHRDVKDENVVLDGDGNIKLIDFGSAAYIKNGPFDVFVGTIDYAAPEVLAGKPYRGKEQDVWALGILLYTIVYKENPFYSIDEIMDRDLRVPYVMSEPSIDLIRLMLERDVEKRIAIEAVLEHPWFRTEDGGNDKEDGEE